MRERPTTLNFIEFSFFLIAKIEIRQTIHSWKPGVGLMDACSPRKVISVSFEKSNK